MNAYKYLPFLDEEDISELVEKIKSGEVTQVPLYKVFPFLSKEALEDLLDYLIEENDASNLTKALPFISKAGIAKIKAAIEDGRLKDFDDARLLPFMDSASIKDLFYQKLNKEKSEENTDQ
jgi:hypothetical protein